MKDQRLELRVSAEEHARWKAAAQALGLTVSAWLRMLATQASKPSKPRRKGARG